MNEESAFLYRHPDVKPGKAEELRGYSKEALACFESEFPVRHPNQIMAEREWQRRFVVEKAFWQRISAWIGVVGALIGAFIAILGGMLLR